MRDQSVSVILLPIERSSHLWTKKTLTHWQYYPWITIYRSSGQRSDWPRFQGVRKISRIYNNVIIWSWIFLVYINCNAFFYTLDMKFRSNSYTSIHYFKFDSICNQMFFIQIFLPLYTKYISKRNCPNGSNIAYQVCHLRYLHITKIWFH